MPGSRGLGRYGVTAKSSRISSEGDKKMFRTFMKQNRLRDIENRLVVAKGEGVGGMDWEFGVSRYRLLHLEWINEVLLHRQGTTFNILE